MFKSSEMSKSYLSRIEELQFINSKLIKKIADLEAQIRMDRFLLLEDSEKAQLFRKIRKILPCTQVNKHWSLKEIKQRLEALEYEFIL